MLVRDKDVTNIQGITKKPCSGPSRRSRVPALAGGSEWEGRARPARRTCVRGGFYRDPFDIRGKSSSI